MPPTLGDDRFVALGGLRLHYTAWGDPAASPVVLVHGVTGHCRSWDSEARALADRHHVLALDLRGHGDSDPAPDADYTVAALAADFGAFVDALGLPRVAVVGLSLGGRVGIAYAGREPSRVTRLVVIDIGPDVAPAGRARVAAQMAGAPERFASIEEALALARAANPRYAEALLAERVRHAVRPLPDDGGLALKYDRALREAVRAGRWRDSIDLWPLWSMIACPTLLVRGAESDILSAETAKRMVQTQPLARLIEVPDAGHTVPGDRPDLFLPLLRDFLAEP